MGYRLLSQIPTLSYRLPYSSSGLEKSAVTILPLRSLFNLSTYQLLILVYTRFLDAMLGVSSSPPEVGQVHVGSYDKLSIKVTSLKLLGAGWFSCTALTCWCWYVSSRSKELLFKKVRGLGSSSESTHGKELWGNETIWNVWGVLTETFYSKWEQQSEEAFYS